jgi:hypothetical protein
MRKYLLEYTLMLAFVALASAGLFVAESSFAVRSARPNLGNEVLPFDCSLPVEGIPSDLPCRP